jgi:hypothetical protein
VGKTAFAHHAFAPVYDGSRSVTVSGVVTEFRFVNPHALIYIDVTDQSGAVAKWTIESHGSLALSEGGWTAETIKKKERVTVTGNPARVDNHRMFFLKLTRADGTELLDSYAERTRNIEEERRQRQRARAQQK